VYQLKKKGSSSELKAHSNVKGLHRILLNTKYDLLMKMVREVKSRTEGKDQVNEKGVNTSHRGEKVEFLIKKRSNPERLGRKEKAGRGRTQI